jgi:mono/diheme cytochrome c family protein
MSGMRVGLRRLSRLLAGAGLLGLNAAVAYADPASTADTAWSPLPVASAAAPAAGNRGSALERRGKEVFDQRCAGCHGPIPEEVYGPPFLPAMPGTQGLAARYQGALPALLEERTDLTADRVRTVVRTGFVSMVPVRPTEVSDDDLDALVAYLTRERR